MWPARYTYVKSTHMDIIMRDCAIGRLLEEDKDMIVSRVICDMFQNNWEMTKDDIPDVR